MKCVCGYEYKRGERSTGDWASQEEKLIAGDVPFVPVETEIMVPAKQEPYSSHEWSHHFDAYLYICPKCGTVRAERW